MLIRTETQFEYRKLFFTDVEDVYEDMIFHKNSRSHRYFARGFDGSHHWVEYYIYPSY